MEACVGAHHLSRNLKGLGRDARLVPAKYVRPYSKGQKNDFRDAEAIAEAVQRPTVKFVAIKTVDQLDPTGTASGARTIGQSAHRLHADASCADRDPVGLSQQTARSCRTVA
jgi:hypothetical protein